MRVLGSREEPPTSVSLEPTNEQESVVSLDADFQELPSSSLLHSFHDLYSSTDGSECETDEDDGHDQQMPPPLMPQMSHSSHCLSWKSV